MRVDHALNGVRGGAGGVRDVPAGGGADGVVHSPALGSVVTLLVLTIPTMAVPGLRIRRAQGKREHTNQEKQLGSKELL